jgi:hypothetical protein
VKIPRWRTLLIITAAAFTESSIHADSPPFTPLPAPHLELTSLFKVEVRDSAEARNGGPKIKVARGNQMFQFKRADGTRVTVADGKRSDANSNNSKFVASLWSTDDGRTWTWREGPSDDAANFGPGTFNEEAAIQFRDNGEILSIAATSVQMKRNIAGNEAFFRDHPNLVNARERHYLSQRMRGARHAECCGVDGRRRREFTGLPDASWHSRTAGWRPARHHVWQPQGGHD